LWPSTLLCYMYCSAHGVFFDDDVFPVRRCASAPSSSLVTDGARQQNKMDNIKIGYAQKNVSVQPTAGAGFAGRVCAGIG
jgi:hypothetical protein